jgi:hypothetical protein
MPQLIFSYPPVLLSLDDGELNSLNLFPIGLDATWTCEHPLATPVSPMSMNQDSHLGPVLR